MLLRFAWIVLLVAGCGRIGYESPAGVTADAALPPALDAAVPPEVDAAAPPDGQDPLASGLVAWYPLDTVEDGFSRDAAGSGHDAACVPDPASCPVVVAGRIGGALQFDTVNHLRVYNDGSLDTPGAFTIAAWVWLEPPYTSAPLSKMLGGGRSDTWQFEFADDARPALTTSNFDAHEVDYADTPVEPATWVHLAGTWDGSSKRLFVDGVMEYELPFEVAWDGSDVVIGGDENDGSPALMFGGRVDDVRIYDRALDEAEIAALAQKP